VLASLSADKPLAYSLDAASLTRTITKEIAVKTLMTVPLTIYQTIYKESAVKRWIGLVLLTIFVIFGTQYFLYINDELFDHATDIRVDVMRRELTAAQMPPDQVGIIVESMRNTKRDVASHVRSTSFILWAAIVIMWLLVLDALSKTKPSQPKGSPE
jgi:hypothetical protein